VNSADRNDALLVAPSFQVVWTCGKESFHSQYLFIFVLIQTLHSTHLNPTFVLLPKFGLISLGSKIHLGRKRKKTVSVQKMEKNDEKTECEEMKFQSYRLGHPEILIRSSRFVILVFFQSKQTKSVCCLSPGHA